MSSVPAVRAVSTRRYRGQSGEERRADQHRRLVRAAIDEFAARGLHRTSVEGIVRGAQVRAKPCVPKQSIAARRSRLR